MELIAFPAPAVDDAPEREQALDVSASWIVEAPAGSGKTGLLIQRLLKLLAIVDAPGEVLALTFTNKATAEMRERVLHALRSASQGTVVSNPFEQLTRSLALAVLQRDAARGWHLQDSPHLLNIRTIDSLCGEIARAVPVLSGGVGFSRPVDDPGVYYRRAAHAVMMRFGGDSAELNDAIRTVLLHRDGDLPYCERILAEMLGTREQWGKLVPLTNAELDEAELEGKVLPRLNESLDHTVCSALTHLHSCFPEAELEALAAIMRRLAHAEGYKDERSAYSSCALAANAPGTDAQHLNHWLLLARLMLTNDGRWRGSYPKHLVGAVVEKQITAELKEILTGIESEELAALLHAVRDLPQPVYPPEQWRVTRALFRLLQHALVELRLLFAAEEVCDFTEISLAARAALESGSALQGTGTELRHLLVDEMQDTSSNQYELLRLLTSGWDGVSQTVFLVGDPKQSIYLFRQARVELFQRCLRDEVFGDVKLHALRLSTNFRSGARIVEEFNEVFQSIFPREDAPDGDVEFHAATAANPARDGEGIRWPMQLLPCMENTAAKRAVRRRGMQHEAREIARIVREWREDAGGKPPRIAVLTRARTHVVEIAKELAKNNTPYRAVEIEALAERREVLDILAVTRALLHGGDRTAWLALLRAPWCGVGVADLFTLAAGDNAAHKKQALRPLLRERLHLLSPYIESRVRRTLAVMDAALTHAGTSTLADRVERTWRSLGGDRCTDEMGRANVRQFLRVLDRMEAEGESIDAASLAHRLERLFAEASHAPDAVDVMTVHKAKGLEWDLVLLPGMHRQGAQDSYQFLNWLELPTYGSDGTIDVLLAPVPSKGGEAGDLNGFIRNKRKARAEAELKRLLYVAATRARTSLHLFAWPEAKKGGAEPSRIHNTLLNAGWNAAASHLQPVGSSETAGGDEPVSLAAAAEDERVVQAPDFAKLQRLPSTFDALARLNAALPVVSKHHQPNRRVFDRPQGSFGARAVGNAIHSFIERLIREFTARLETSASAAIAADELAAAIPSWSRSVAATLRSGGLPPDEVGRAAHTVERALTTLLQSEDGRWLLLPHHAATTESAWRGGEGSDAVRVRLDRTFFAGSAPHRAGSDTFWIVDFKTADHAEAGREQFLKDERDKYADQLRTYAEIRVPTLAPDTPILLGLFYPLMGRLVWWPYQAAANARPLADVEPAADVQRVADVEPTADIEPVADVAGQFSLFG